jgi:hypothetical protein
MALSNKMSTTFDEFINDMTRSFTVLFECSKELRKDCRDCGNSPESSKSKPPPMFSFRRRRQRS